MYDDFNSYYSFQILLLQQFHRTTMVMWFFFMDQIMIVLLSMLAMPNRYCNVWTMRIRLPVNIGIHFCKFYVIELEKLFAACNYVGKMFHSFCCKDHCYGNKELKKWYRGLNIHGGEIDRPADLNM